MFIYKTVRLNNEQVKEINIFMISEKSIMTYLVHFPNKSLLASRERLFIAEVSSLLNNVWLPVFGEDSMEIMELSWSRGKNFSNCFLPSRCKNSEGQESRHTVP